MKITIRTKIVLLASFLSFGIFPALFGQSSTGKAVPIFKDGAAQIVPAFDTPDDWIRHDLWVETEFDSDFDGKLDRMHVAVTRPVQTETEGLKLPVIYETSPYFAGVAADVEGAFWDVKHEIGATPPPHIHPPVNRSANRTTISKSQEETWIKRGYIVVHSSSPGTGLSQGFPTVGGDNESLAPKAVIDWLCGRAKGYSSPDGNEAVKAYWSTGRVGMTGTSYNGTLPLAAATTGVEGLEAIIPIAPNTSYYHYYRSNGLIRHPGGYLGEDIDVLYDFISSGDPKKRALADSLVRDTEMAKGMDRLTGDYNDFWAGRDYLNDLEPLKTPMLMSHGFNDWNVMPEHSYRIYKAVKEKGNVPAQIFYHQNGHGGPPPIHLMNRWFTRYLHNVENGVEKDPKSWIVRENDELENPTPYEDYPNPKAAPVKLYLTAGAPKTGGLTATSKGNQGKETLVDNYSFDGKALAKADYTNHRLLYLTPTLQEDLHLSGLANIKIRVASSKPAVNLSIWLVSLPWDEGRNVKITDNIITRGWADPQNYASLTSSKPLELGKFYDLSFDLQPDDQVIAKGQQIGLMIFSSDKDFTLWPQPGTELTIDLEGTVLTLPVVGGVAAYARATK